jgi:hypothetical protein
MTGRQLRIDGGEEPRALPTAPAGHEALPLFPMPAHLRGQLSAWAESVVGPSERDLGVLADWACEVVDDER